MKLRKYQHPVRDIAEALLLRRKIGVEVASIIAEAVWE
jgi:hypothetical protein